MKSVEVIARLLRKFRAKFPAVVRVSSCASERCLRAKLTHANLKTSVCSNQRVHSTRFPLSQLLGTSDRPQIISAAATCSPSVPSPAATPASMAGRRGCARFLPRGHNAADFLACFVRHIDQASIPPNLSLARFLDGALDNVCSIKEHKCNSYGWIMQVARHVTAGFYQIRSTIPDVLKE